MNSKILHQRYALDQIFADSGGMGLIYKARDLKCAENKVLIKTTRYDVGEAAQLLRNSTQSALSLIEKQRKILNWEKKIFIKFSEVINIPSINDFFVDQSLTLKKSYGSVQIPDQILKTEPFLVMEFIDAKPLDKVWDQFREALEWHVLKWARQMTTLFIRFHKRESFGNQEGYFIYQDLKPANLLVSKDGDLTLIDMGAVTLKLGAHTTEPTAGCVTKGYAAPEAEEHPESIDHRFDLYTLGVVMWEALSGQHPQDFEAFFPTLPLEALNQKNYHPQTLALVQKALARNPEQRFQSAAAMRKAIIQAMKAIQEEL